MARRAGFGVAHRRPRCPAADRGWGLFLPLYALRTEQDWGVGSYADMAELGQWAEEMGGVDAGCPAPVSRFFGSAGRPEPLSPRESARPTTRSSSIRPCCRSSPAAPEARRLLGDDEFRRQLSSAHQSTLVDYETVSRLRRQVLAPMAEALLATGSARREAFCAWVDAHPELVAYARFRAAGDRLGHRPGTGVTPRPSGRRVWRVRRTRTPSRPSGTTSTRSGWRRSNSAPPARRVPLYADLPIGVHPDGFDPVWAPGSFVRGAHGGAPPDLFFAGGQDWAFPPLHPERMRDDGYHYFIGVLRRAFRHAAYLRVDHIMGLQRLYWIPEGFDARHGAYVSYRADELHAVVALEAHRAGAVVVGEDLGTVPDGVRARMAEDGMLRSWVLQFESTAVDPLPPAPSGVLASWGTHDLPRFVSYFSGDDIDEQEREGSLAPSEAAAARDAAGRYWRAALLRALGVDDRARQERRGRLALRGCLLHLASSAADLVLVDLEDLWGEREPQNRPGTGVGAANWRRRGVRTLARRGATTGPPSSCALLSRGP